MPNPNSNTTLTPYPNLSPTTDVFNVAIHQHLISLGYEYEYREACWEEYGDIENGPKIWGYEEFDSYTNYSDGEVIAINKRGQVDARFDETMPEPELEPEPDLYPAYMCGKHYGGNI